MKNNNSFNLFVVSFLLIAASCTNSKNDEAFLKKIEGRYLYSDDETVTIYSKENTLLIDWRGAKAIAPSKIDENTFYVKEMNAKIQFLTNPEDQKIYLVFLPKNKEEKIEFTHKKMQEDEKIPSEYLRDGNYEKALEAYLAIKAKDSLSPILNRRGFRNKGYSFLSKDSVKLAIDVFKINTALHPTESNPYDNLGEAYLKLNDTVNALKNYTKALEFDSGNRRIKRQIEKLQGKEVENIN
jgi:tetratricopeptide (TPR) repeat protein